MSDDLERLSIITEAAQRLGVSIDTVRRRIKSGEIDAQRDNVGKWWVFIAEGGEDEQPSSSSSLTRTSPHPPVFLQQAHPQDDVIEHLKRENERLWDMLKSKDVLIRDLALRAAGAEASAAAQAERDNARDQLRELKLLVAKMLQKAREDD